MASAIDPQVRSNHQALSPVWEQFLDHVADRPEWHEHGSFPEIDEIVTALQRLRYQPWPTLIDSARLEQAHQANSALCNLLKSLPLRLFAGDAERLQSFYGLPVEMQPLLRFALRRPKQLEMAIGRSDLVLTSAGFRCLEFNISANAGGWGASVLGRRLQHNPLYQEFIASVDAEIDFTDVVHRTLSHALSCGLQTFRSPEINIALQMSLAVKTPPAAGRDSVEIYQELVQSLGLRGRAHRCVAEEPEARGGNLYVGGDRIHVLLEVGRGLTTPASYRCWMHDSVLLLNGPLTLLLTDKRTLALASELAAEDFFTGQERELVDSWVPWTRRLTTETVAGVAPSGVTPEQVIAQRQDLVLKAASGTGGSDIVMGCACTAAEWENQVAHAFAAGDWVAQRRVESLSYAYLDASGAVVPHDVVWGLLVVGDRYGGDILRLAPRRQSSQVISGSLGAQVGPLWQVKAAS